MAQELFLVKSMFFFSNKCSFNPLTPMNDQERILPYNINTISSRQVMSIKKTAIRLKLVKLTFEELYGRQ